MEEEILRKVLNLTAVEKNDAFPELDVSGLFDDEVRLSSDMVHGNPSIQKFVQLLTNGGFDTTVRYNEGTGCVSFSFPLPTSYPELAEFAENPQKALLWIAFGLFPCQVEMEHLYQALSPGNENVVDTADSPTKKQPSRPTLFANFCLVYLTQCTHVAIIKLDSNPRSKLMTIMIEPAKRQLFSANQGKRFSDKMKRVFQFNPSYTDLICVTPVYTPGKAEGSSAPRIVPKAEQVESYHALAESMLKSFWRSVTAAHYCPHDELKQLVSKGLLDFFFAAIKSVGPKEGFAPKLKIMKLYLYGPAGSGKSSFSLICRSALEATIQTFLDPTKKVKTVKIPLNSMSEVNLRSELMVRGISDMSIERLLEQTICKGDIALFHLEESPKNEDSQVKIFEMVDQVTKSIVGRYPEYRSNLMYLFTSNYLPAPSIKSDATLITMSPPVGDVRMQWCQRVLKDALETLLKDQCTAVKITLNTAPPNDEDMRFMEKWQVSLSHGIAHHLRPHLIASGGSTDSVNLQIEFSESQANISGSFECSDGSLNVPPLELRSQDGYFFYTPVDSPTSTCSDNGMVQSVLRLVACNALEPGVVAVVGGTSEQRDSVISNMALSAKEYFADRLHTKSVTLLSDACRTVVEGDRTQLRGGLYRFLDGITSKAAVSKAGRQEFALVTANINYTGQYILRELLESGSSLTHRLLIRKTGVLFLLNIADELTSTVRSRSHVVIQV